MAFCGSLTSTSVPCSAKASAQAGADPFSSLFLPQMTVFKFDVTPFSLLSSADFFSQFAIKIPASGPRPLLLSRRISKRLRSRRLRNGSTERTPNALSLRSISARVDLGSIASHKAFSASGISEMRRPVKISAKSATCSRSRT